MRTFSNILFSTLILVCLSQAYADDPWYVNYENGIKAIEEEKWSAALDYFDAALAERAEPKTNAKTYGLRFVDYLPYLYRGVAHYHLGNLEQAGADLQQSQNFGEVTGASRDKAALTRFQRYSKLIEQARQGARQQQQIQALMSAATTAFEQQDLAAAEENIDKILQLEAEHAEAQELMERLDAAQELRSQKPSPATPPTTSSINDEKPADGSPGRRSVAENPPPAEKIAREDVAEKSEAPDETQTMFDAAAAAFERGDLSTAKTNLDALLETSPDHTGAREYVAEIAEIEQQIQSGIRAYFAGKNETAIRELNAAEQRCRTSRNLYLFLGCAYSAQYFLTGERDEQLLQNAMANFKNVRRLDSDFKPDRRYFSPRIITLFENN